MGRLRRVPKKFPIRWTNADGSTIEYVDRAESELRAELERVRDHGFRAAKVLSRIRTGRHVVIVAARFELEHCQRVVPDDASSAWLSAEIARLSYVYQQTLELLNRLSNSRIHWLEETRFLLTYGQTPKKREAAGNFTSRGSSYEPEGVQDPEETTNSED
jgi:hypothetical protein